MADIRPTGRSLPEPVSAPAAQPRSAAQRAFFEAALGKAQATATVPVPVSAPAPQTVAPARPTAPAMRPIPVETVTIPPEAPTRYLRPGSLLDIKV